MKRNRSLALVGLILAAAVMLPSCSNPFASAFISRVVKLGAQSGVLIAGTAGSASFSVSTIHIPSGTVGTISWYSSPAGSTGAGAPAGILATVSAVAGDAANLSMATTTVVAAGTYYFKLTVAKVSSSIATLTVNGPVATPSLSLGGGTYSSDLSITIGCATPGATIYYTLTPGAIGTPPTTSSTPYTGPIPVAGDGTTVTLEALAVKSGMSDSTVVAATYVLNYSQVSTPGFSMGGGTYSTDQSITISCATPGATIYYTLTPGAIGTPPTTLSTPYTGPIPVAGNGTTMTLEALAVKGGMSDSSLGVATYVINYSQVSTPSFSVTAGTYSSDQYVAINCLTPGATIYYTLTPGAIGTPPTTLSTPYAGPIPVLGPGTTVTIEALAVKGGMSDSTVISASYVVDAGQPMVSMLSIVSTLTASPVITNGPVSVSFIVQDAWLGVVGYYVGESPTPTGFTSIANTGTAATPETLSYTLSGGDGAKTVYVFAQDAAGNASMANSGSITLDATAPTFAVGVATKSGIPGYAQNGDTITIPFTVTETLSGLAGMPSLMLGGRVAVVAGAYPNYAAILSVDGAMAEGMLGYDMTATDAAGNSAVPVSGSTGIVVDRTPPTIAVGTATTTGNPGFARNIDTITIPIAVTDLSGLAGLDVQIGGIAATLSGAYPNYTASVPGSVIGSDGPIGYSISATDAAGNASPASGSTGIVLDRLPPSFSGVIIDGGAGSTASMTVSVMFIASDAIGLAAMSVGESPTPSTFMAYAAPPVPCNFQNNTNETKTIYVFVKDGAGNMTTASGTIDYVGP